MTDKNRSCAGLWTITNLFSVKLCNISYSHCVRSLSLFSFSHPPSITVFIYIYSMSCMCFVFVYMYKLFVCLVYKLMRGMFQINELSSYISNIYMFFFLCKRGVTILAIYALKRQKFQPTNIGKMFVFCYLYD